MPTRAPLLLSLALIAGMLAIDAWAWPHLSATARIATHFDFHGKPNGFLGRDLALAAVPLLASLLTLVFLVLPHLTRRRAGLAASWSAYVSAWMGTLTVLFVSHAAIVFAARGWPVDVAGSTSIALNLLLIAVGNVLGKTRPNAFVGVRTIWSRKSDYAWDKSNRAAARMMVATGLIALGVLASAGAHPAHIVTVTGVIITAVTSVLLSYVYWRHDPSRTTPPDGRMSP